MLLIYRLVFRYILGVPFFILRVSLDFVKKLHSLDKMKYQNTQAYINTIFLNFSTFYISDLNFLISTKFDIKNRYITINPPKPFLNELFFINSNKLFSHIVKESIFFYGKPNEYFEKPRYLFVLNFNKNFNINGKSSLLVSTSKHSEMKLFMNSLYKNDFYKSYQTHYFKGPSFDNVEDQ